MADINSYRKQFNKDMIYMINILNKIFNIPSMTPTATPQNFISIENKIPETLAKVGNNTLTYESLNTQRQNELQQSLFNKICQNLALVYSTPINNTTPLEINDKFPLNKTLTTQKNFGNVGVRSDNMEEYQIDNGGVITRKEFTEVQIKICDTDKAKALKEYLYLKLKILVYLRSVLNLYEDENINKWEKIYINSNKSTTMKGVASTNLNLWYKNIQDIFKKIQDDRIDINGLKDIVNRFENKDDTTKNLCKAIVKLCDPEVNESICNDGINIYSVTKEICAPSLKKILDESIQLDNIINEKIRDPSIPEQKFNDLKKKKEDLTTAVANVISVGSSETEKMNQIIELNNKKRKLLEDISKPTDIIGRVSSSGSVKNLLTSSTSSIVPPSLKPIETISTSTSTTPEPIKTTTTSTTTLPTKTTTTSTTTLEPIKTTSTSEQTSITPSKSTTTTLPTKTSTSISLGELEPPKKTDEKIIPSILPIDEPSSKKVVDITKLDIPCIRSGTYGKELGLIQTLIDSGKISDSDNEILKKLRQNVINTVADKLRL